MRVRLRDLAATLLDRSGLSGRRLRHVAAQRRVALEFHGVASQRYRDVATAAQPSFCAEELETVLRWLSDRFAFLSPEEFLQGTRAGVLLTFDDGFANHEEVVLPILEGVDAPAVFFVATQHVQDPADWLPATRAQASLAWAHPAEIPRGIARDLFDGMSRQQVKRCADHPLVTLGAHTVGHSRLTTCSDRDLLRELAEARSVLQQATGRDVGLLAYPCGDYDARVARVAWEVGYAAAFAERRRHLAPLGFEIPRVGIYGHGSAYLGAKLSGWDGASLPLGSSLVQASTAQHGRE